MDDWWQAAPPDRRADFLRAVRSGQLEVTALPFNQTPFLNATQWRTMRHGLPENLWQQLRPTVAVQNDVNGFPRAGAMALLDRGIRHLFMGINSDSGGPPCYRPSAFGWKMPDGRRMFVWLDHSYPAGFNFFETYEWRRGPVPRAGDMEFRPPRGSDVFKTDEASLRAAHAQCQRRIAQLREEGYPHDLLTRARGPVCRVSVAMRRGVATVSSGGMAFTPYEDQLAGSCRDYYGIDGWAHYDTAEGHWLWVSRDAPLMTLGGPHVWKRRSTAPPDAHRIPAMLLNNAWHTNFAGDEHGVMAFQFDLVWEDALDDPLAAQQLAESLSANPVVLINGPGADDARPMHRLFTP